MTNPSQSSLPSASNPLSDSPSVAAGISTDPMSAGNAATISDQLLNQLALEKSNASTALLAEIELTKFSPAQRSILLPLLWQFIQQHRDSNQVETLVAVGSAIRKYIALLPMDQMGQLAQLLESGHRSVLPIELEIEVAKMIGRNFEIHPPVSPDPHPDLAKCLLDLVKAYSNPRIITRDKHSAAASLSIQAIVAMRSPLAQQAVQVAALSPFRWFSEIVGDGLQRLHDQWAARSPESAAWLMDLQSNAIGSN